MRADELRPKDERHAYGHLLYSISSVRNDGVNVHARVYWAFFDAYDEVSWWVGQEVPGIVRPDAVTGQVPRHEIRIDPASVQANDTGAEEIASNVARLTSWFR